MIMFKPKPWLVYYKKGVFAVICARFTTELQAQKRKKELTKRVPTMRFSVAFERPKPVPIANEKSHPPTG